MYLKIVQWKLPKLKHKEEKELKQKQKQNKAPEPWDNIKCCNIKGRVRKIVDLNTAIILSLKINGLSAILYFIFTWNIKY